MEQFLAHFQEYLILLLLGTLFFKESITAFINEKLGIKSDKTTPEWATRLSNYVNHDQTEYYKALQKTIDGISQILHEFKEYGVKVRKE